MVVPQTKTQKVEGKVFHDPVHGQIALHPLLVKIIDTPEFQRLRNIKQLGGVPFVYPSGCHTRFEHSIGVAHLAGELAYNLRSRQEELNITEKEILCVQIAGLCHDLGHGPFSHLFDNMFIQKDKDSQGTEKDKGNSWKHEDASVRLFDHLLKKNGLEAELKEHGLKEKDLTFIKEMINPVENQNKWPFKGRCEEKSFLYEIVANKLNGIDVDKFDYLDRDCHHLGLKNTFDYRRFFLLARVCEVEGRKHICMREKDTGNLYDMFYSRYSLHRRVYKHKVVQNVEMMITDAFRSADSVPKLSEAIKEEDAFRSADSVPKLSEAIKEEDAFRSADSVPKLSEAIKEEDAFRSADSVPKLSEAIQEEDAFRSANSVLKLSEAIKEENIEDYIKLTDEVFEKILHSTDENMVDARAILQNVHKRNLYKFVGEAKDIPDEEKQRLITKLKEILLPPGSLEFHTFKFDYGKGDQDPLKKMYFYRKDNPETGFPIPSEERSTLLPEHFCEKRFRVYWKNTENNDEAEEKLKKAKERFFTWFHPDTVGAQTEDETMKGKTE